MIYFMSKLGKMSLIGLFSCGFFGQAIAQQTPQGDAATPFASENAILDTALPFAIGAQEAQQSLRGSFGWPTFQEGLVEGVYFRFDPDGYARFAPTPRLDSDVFEVICRPRTFSCMGRKGTLSVILNSRGQLQLKIDDILQGDRFFVSEGVSEIELPERILQPLDTQLELLLSTGGDLIVRRADKEKERISLTGFYPVSAYLRWVAARQDYTILPRGWPVPNSSVQSGGVTQAGNWQSPMPQPQNFPTGSTGSVGGGQVNAQNNSLQVTSTDASNAQTDVAEVKGELKILRELLLKRALDGSESSPGIPQTTDMNMQKSEETESVSDQIAALRQAAEQIQADLARLSTPQPQANSTLATTHLEQPVVNTMQHAVQPTPVTNDANKTAARLHYLMTEIGLDAKTALMLVQMNASASNATMSNSGGAMTATTPISNPAAGLQNSNQDNVVAQILAELEADIGSQNQAEAIPQPASTAPVSISPAEYQLLSSYFKSIAFPSQ